ncbi:E3 ubiquitin-protein ligase TRIM39-like, partial [Apteryx mantelli]|uniref:E3 ubiquitin-protein ligase TRIM39-like n=1 Tax=Apteryx mantelli TaxID=2696672 RepID=A0ABM4FXM9_9AVES
ASAPDTLTLLVPAEEVSLDPDTAHRQLILSEDCKSVRWGETQQDLPDSYQRFNSSFCVLGREGFTVGRHCWEVEGEVGAEQHWSVGVARESLRRKEPIEPSPDKDIWAVQYRKGKFVALTSPRIPLSLYPVPKRIWVCLDCTEGQVTFVNADNGAEIYMFQSVSLRPSPSTTLLVTTAPKWVGIFLDYEAGEVSFYNLTHRSHLFAFTSSLSEPLHPYFNLAINKGGQNAIPLTTCPVPAWP